MNSPIFSVPGVFSLNVIVVLLSAFQITAVNVNNQQSALFMRLTKCILIPLSWCRDINKKKCL